MFRKNYFGREKLVNCNIMYKIYGDNGIISSWRLSRGESA
jgi:hypothetical protein